MTEAIQELKDLIVALDKKVDIQASEIKGEINLVRAEVLQAKTELSGKIDQMKTELNGQIERVGEKLEGVSKRVDQQEILSRTAFAGLLVAVTSGFIKYLFFN